MAEVADISPGLVTITRACRSCGSDRHGRPQAVIATGGPDLHISLSRSGGMTLVAVSDAGAVGVDLEAIAGHHEDLTAWVRTESLVKATGHGLTIDPGRLDDVVRHTIDLDAPDGFVAAVTVLTDVPPQVVMRPAAPEA